MKTFLFLAVGSVVTAGLLPGLPAKIILSGFVLLAVLNEAVRRVRILPSSRHPGGRAESKNI